MKKITTLRFIAHCLILCPVLCLAQNSHNDSLALLALYNATNGINWTNTWNLAQPMNAWNGITLSENGRVIELYLPENQLVGEIPIEITNLTELTFLSLAKNQLSGDIPAEIGNLANVEWLILGDNQLSGNIPVEIGNLSNLITLDLYSNQLSGSLPSEIGNLTNLQRLWASSNQFTGSIPPEIGNLTNLISLLLYDNDLSGNFPIELTNLTTNLNWLSLSSNQFSGNIPPEIGNMTNLIGLSLNDNQFTGIIPSEIGNLTNLDGLSLSSNQLTGNIPHTIGNLSNLITLYLNTNEIGGAIPSTIGNLASLDALLLHDNQLTENIPTTIGNMTNLRVFWVASNQLTGGIPASINNLTNLEELWLTGNDLKDTIPNLENLTKLVKLNLSYNELSGNMPNLGSYQLQQLALNDNKLTGNIPVSVGNSINLTYINLSRNELSGDITSLENLIHLDELNLSNNQFSGLVPDFSHLEKLHIYKNKFSFEDIEIAYNTNSSVSDFDYSPQYHGERQGYTQNFGDTLTLTLSEPLSGNNNQNVSYQWQKNYNELTGVTDSTYTINDLQLHDVGKYTIHMTDPSRVPDLEIISETIYVIVPGYGLYGQPVAYNQIMMEFDDAADKLDYETEYLHPNAGFVADSCNCNRELYLWQFPSDSAALEVLLAVNTERESIGRRRADVDGGFNNIFNIGPMVSGEGWTWAGDYTENYPDSVLVFLLDSGLDTAHWDASPYLLDTAPVDNCYNTSMSSGYDYTDSLTTINGNFADSLGHGTYGFRSITEGLGDHINLKVVPLKAFDKEGAGTLFNFVCALYHAIDHDADIIHVSAGYTGGASDILENAIALSKKKGCLLVTAAGNDGADIDSIPQYPAYYAKEFYKKGFGGNDSLVHYNNIISVASIGSQDELSAFSNYGNEAVVMSAYGEDMSGYSHTGEQISSSGSSVSAFYVTRELAVEIAKNKNRTHEQIWQDFEVNCLRDCPETANLTKTGKRLNINLNEVYADLRVYLEGAYDTTAHKMHSDLNMMHLLPGQIIGDSTLNHELAVQPYSAIPPYYQGNESVPEMFSNYPDNVVDWILISLRAEKSADTELSRTAAWLLESGDVQLLKPLLEDIHTAPDSVFVVIEHRNHLWTMSPQKIPVNRNIITCDFTAQNGYTTLSATGQIQILPGVWTMLAGDSEQEDVGGGDINGGDKIIWQDDNGSFLLYLKGDYNLNGDANGEDKIFWERNNGKFSGIPK